MTTSENPTVHLDLTLNDVNFIIATLQKKPYEEVSLLIGTIYEQANNQLIQQRTTAGDGDKNTEE